MKRITSIQILFTGLLLVFVDITIDNFNLLGYLMLILGLSKLENYSRSFLKASRFTIISFAWQLFSVVISFFEFSKQKEITYSFIIIGVVLNIIMTYYIIKGLSGLADDQGLTNLSKRLKRGFRFGLITLELALMFIFSSSIVTFFLILAIIIYIYVLAQIYCAYKSIDGTNFEEPARESGKKAVFKSVLFMTLFVILIGIYVLKNFVL